MDRGKGSFWAGCLLGATVSVSVIGLAFVFQRSHDDGNDASTQKDRSVIMSPHRLSLASPRGFGFLGRRNLKESSFFTDIIEMLWPYIKIAGAETIRASVEPSFAAFPGPMKTCRFTKLDLGTVPLRMDNIVVHPLQADGSVQFDLDLHWDGDCDFELKADYVGTFGVKHLKLFGRMAVVLKPLGNQLPIVSAIQYGFINMPTIDISFSGLAAVADLSILESTVQEAIKSSLATSVLPYRRLYKMKDTNNFLDTYQPPVGVLRLTILNGNGFVIEKRFLAPDDVPDVYLNVSVGQDAIWRTKTIVDCMKPVWNEVRDFCLYDREQTVRIHAYDEDEGSLDADDALGTTEITVADVLLSPRRTAILPLTMANQSNKKLDKTGASITVSCDICEWTPDLSSLSSSKAVNAEICGLLVVIVNRAFNIPLDPKTACTFVKLTYASKEHATKMIYSYPGWDPLNPNYDTAFTIPIDTDMPRDDTATIQLDLISLSGESSTVLGSRFLTLGDLKDQPDNKLTETCCIGDKGASLEYRISLSGVTTPPSKETYVAAPQFTPRSPEASSGPSRKDLSNPTNLNRASFGIDEGSPVGSFEFVVVKARGLTVRQDLFAFDVPDVFFEIDFEKKVFTTSVKYNNITPEWNESKIWKLTDHGQQLLVKGWDKSERADEPDIPIGAVKLTVGNLLLAGGSVELELMNPNGLPSGVFVTLRAHMV